MNKALLPIGSLLLVLGLLTTGAFAGPLDVDPDGEYLIAVSPQALILGAKTVEWVTVHTNIRYGEAVNSSLTLNDVPVIYTKADNRGFLVAKFDRIEIEQTVEIPETVMEFSGVTVDGVEFSAFDTIRVAE